MHTIAVRFLNDILMKELNRRHFYLSISIELTFQTHKIALSHVAHQVFSSDIGIIPSRPPLLSWRVLVLNLHSTRYPTPLSTASDRFFFAVLPSSSFCVHFGDRNSFCVHRGLLGIIFYTDFDNETRQRWPMAVFYGKYSGTVLIHFHGCSPECRQTKILHTRDNDNND